MGTDVPKKPPAADPTKPAQYCIEKMNGCSMVSHVTGIPVSTVWDWWNDGYFPSRWRGEPLIPMLFDASKTLAAGLAMPDFMVPRDGG